MFDWLVAKLSTFRKRDEPVDPSRFDDPLARCTEWTPKSDCSASFCTHGLAAVAADRMEFKITTAARLFYSGFVVTGLLVTGFGARAWAEVGADGLHSMMSLGVGALFAVVGSVASHRMSVPIVFDRTESCFVRGRVSRSAMFPRAPEYFVPFDSIHAVQLVSKLVRGAEMVFRGYELNLVLHDGERVNVIDHGNLERIRRDARTLAEFLGVPVWDGVR